MSSELLRFLCSYLVLSSCVCISYSCRNDPKPEPKPTPKPERHCSEIKPDFAVLKHDLETKLYGQHLVKDTVYNAIREHLMDSNSDKPLVMSFHGWTGGGKSYVKGMIVNNIYPGIYSSKFVHFLSGIADFKHVDKAPEYMDVLQKRLHSAVTLCSRSVFVFDELEKMPLGVLDAINPYLGNEPTIHGVDYRSCIFIFLSNAGGNRIMEETLKVWKSGAPRESIKLKDMQKMLQNYAYNGKHGLGQSSIVGKNLVDHYVPFLPLEREHVRSCVLDVMRDRYQNYVVTESMIENILDELDWYEDHYSVSGCKKIRKKVGLHVKTEL